MSLRFAAPLLLALGVPLVLLTIARLRALPESHQGPRRRVIQALLLLASLTAALAVAQLEWGTRLDRMAVVFALDRSRSVERSGEDGGAEALASAREGARAMAYDDVAGLVVFGAESATEVMCQPSPELSRSHASIARDATDIGGGLRRALAELPADYAGRVVLISDGVETEGDALAAAQLAAGRGIPIDVVAIERTPEAEIAVERVQLPPTADPDEPIELRVVTRATTETDVRVRVLRDGAPIAEADTHVAAGTDVLTLRDLAGEPGVHRYDVLLEPLDVDADAAPENNEGGAFVRVNGASRALIVSERPEEATALLGAIERAGLEVEAVGPARMPIDLAEMASFDLIVLSDLDARNLLDAQMDALRAYVRDLGGGLLMLGVRDAFGLGGYAYTAVEEALPATFDLRRRRDRASLAMVIAIDKSGSMMVEAAPGVTKLDLANEAAARSAMLLSPRDRIGVEHVDTGVTWTLRMTEVTEPGPIASTIRAAQPGGGGIYVDVALEAAYGELRDQPTQLRHLLLFSDGSDSEAMSNARNLVSGALRDGITTSIVSMGAGPDSPELERLARMGGGRFYIVDDMRELPRIFTQETIEASRSAVVEEAFQPLLGAASPITDGIDFGEAPALGGYVVMNSRPRASVLLGATDVDPLLATWQFGVGRSAVFGCDAGAAFARPWLAWGGYDALFGQLARALARTPATADADLHVGITGGAGSVRVEALDASGRFRNHLDLGAVISSPDGSSITVPVVQSGPGRYEADFDASAPGPYLVTVRELNEDGTGEMVGSVGVVRSRGDELRGEGTNHELLARIASVSGGEVRTELRELFVDRPAPTWAYAPLWRPLLMIAMLSLLLSVAARRLVIPDGWQRRLRGARRAPASTSTASTPSEASPGPRAPLAPELQASLDATADAPAPEAKDVAKGATSDAPSTPAKPAAPASLAEHLLARRKNLK